MNDELKAQLVGKTEHRDANIRSVEGGYVISTNRRWVDGGTGQVVYAIQAEAIASDGADAADYVGAFLNGPPSTAN